MTDKKTTQTFNQVPTDILDNKELSLLDKFIYGEVFTMSVQGKEFFMSNARLAERYGKSIPTIKRSMQHLKDMGLITVKIQRNEQKMVTKRMVSVGSPMTLPRVTDEPRVGSPMNRGGVTSEPYNRSINRSIEYTNALESDFEKLWKLYPNKKGKDLAFKAYQKAIKDGATNKDIQDGIVGLKKEITFKETDKKFIPHGGTWFNQKRWEDEYETGSVETSVNNDADEILRLENELKDENLDPIERSFMERKLADLKGDN